MNKSNIGVLLAVTTAIFWGLLAIALKVAVRVVDSYTIVWFRFFFAAIALFIWMWFTDRKSLNILKKPPLMLLVASVALAINYIGFMLGVKYTSPSNAQVIIQISQVLFAIAGIVIFKEKIKKSQIIGFVVLIIGFALFYMEQLNNMQYKSGDFILGVTFTLIGAITWTFYAIIQKKLLPKYEPQTQNIIIFTLPIFLYLPLVNFNTLGSLNIYWWGLLIFLGINTLIAYGCMTASLKYLEANKVSAILINNPIITFIIMAILTAMDVKWIEGENFSVMAWIGALLFIFGAFMVVKSRKK
ncbi:MAG: DMT family transporter [Prolixibacteraceae bacterium]|nr:DMT family transporter [Prolixibacteraceae bacterium]